MPEVGGGTPSFALASSISAICDSTLRPKALRSNWEHRVKRHPGYNPMQSYVVASPKEGIKLDQTCQSQPAKAMLRILQGESLGLPYCCPSLMY